MSRSDQWIGLNDWAREYLRRVAISEEALKPIEGAWMSTVGHTCRYLLAEGGSVESFVQSVPWQSGPMYFLALRHADGSAIPETLWTETELDGDGRFYEWTPERGYLLALDATAFEAGRYLLALLRRDEIGVFVYAQTLDNCIQALDYHELEVGLPYTSSGDALDGDYPQLLIQIGRLARELRKLQRWNEPEDAADVIAALGRYLGSWAEHKQAERAEMFAGNVAVDPDEPS